MARNAEQYTAHWAEARQETNTDQVQQTSRSD